MHDTAMDFGRLFFDVYVKRTSSFKVVDVGSQDVNGSLRSVAPKRCEYIGVDFAPGQGVDVVIKDPYTLPFKSDSIDVVVSSSCFEHTEFFWLVFIEIQRVLKSDGLLYINVPSNGAYHRYPVDCWRFYPESGVALRNWARKNGYKTELLESFIGNRNADMWNDFVAIFVKDSSHAGEFLNRISERTDKYTNGMSYGGDNELITSRPQPMSEDQLLLAATESTDRQLPSFQDVFHNNRVKVSDK